MQCEPKDNDEVVAHQQLTSTISIEARMTKAKTNFEFRRLKQVEVRESCDLRPPTFGGNLAREVKAPDMNNFQAVIY